MTVEQLEKAKKLQEQIEVVKTNITNAKYTQFPEVVVRKSYLRFHGIEGEIEVPETLFRLIGRAILSEYNMKLSNLEKEFNAL